MILCEGMWRDSGGYRWGYGIACDIPKRIVKKTGGAVTRSARAPSSGAARLISALDALLEPVQHLLLDPSDPALAELYPLRERSGRLKAGDVLRAVQYKLLKLALR
jgi:hypothetical protein